MSSWQIHLPLQENAKFKMSSWLILSLTEVMDFHYEFHWLKYFHKLEIEQAKNSELRFKAWLNLNILLYFAHYENY